MFLHPALGSQMQSDLRELETILVYIVSSRATQLDNFSASCDCSEDFFFSHVITVC